MLVVQFVLAHEQPHIEEVDGDVVLAVALLCLPTQLAGTATMRTAHHFQRTELRLTPAQHRLVGIIAYCLHTIVVLQLVDHLVILPFPPVSLLVVKLHLVGHEAQHTGTQLLVQSGEEYLAIHLKHERRVYAILRLRVNPVFQPSHNRVQRYEKN